MSDLTLYFVRHGESVANLSDRNGDKRPGDADRLSELGWEQARGLGRRLQGEGLELIVASPMTRAQQTAQRIAEVLGLPFETDEDLFEVRQSDAFYASSPDYGETGTLSWMPTAARDFAEPGAESFDDIVARVHRVMERLGELASERRIVAGAALMGVVGKVQKEGAVLHVIAERLFDYSDLLGRLVTRSRDFH